MTEDTSDQAADQTAAQTAAQTGRGVLEVRDDGTYVLRFERHLAHPPGRVWRALTEPDELRHWFPTDIEGERKPGAALRFVFREPAPRAADMPDQLVRDPEDLDGVLTSYEPPNLLAYTWGEESLRWELTPTTAGCLLAFTHTFTGRSGIPHPAGPLRKAARTAAGWDICLAVLDGLLDGSGPPPGETWPALYDRYVQKFG